MIRKLTIFTLTLMSFSCFCFAQDSTFNGDISDIQGSVYICLKVEGIDGESLVDKHNHEIDLLTWNWGMTQAGFMSVGRGGAAAKTQVQDLVVTKYVDKASPGLMLACLKGEHIPEATLFVIKGGGSALEYIKITMSPVIVTSVTPGGNQDIGLTTENVALNFAKVTFSYTPQDDLGNTEPSVEFTWNIQANQEE